MSRTYFRYGLLYDISRKIYDIMPVHEEGNILFEGKTIYTLYAMIEKDKDYPPFLVPYQVQRVVKILKEFGEILIYNYSPNSLGNLYLKTDKRKKVGSTMREIKVDKKVIPSMTLAGQLMDASKSADVRIIHTSTSDKIEQIVGVTEVGEKFTVKDMVAKIGYTESTIRYVLNKMMLRGEVKELDTEESVRHRTSGRLYVRTGFRA